MNITEAIYNSFVDLAYIICELRKQKSGEPGSRVRGKFYVPDQRSSLPPRRDPQTGKLYRPSASRLGIRSQEADRPREGDTELKLKKHYKRLHKKANAGDKKAMELLRRAEMSDNP